MGGLYLPPPLRRLVGELRLPLIQHPGERSVEQLQGSMLTSDSLRRVKTTSNRIALGPLPAIQQFHVAEVGSPNTAESMQSGLRARNASRAGGRGQGAGI